MNKQVIQIAKEFYVSEGGIGGYTFWDELEAKFAKMGIELSYLEWDELEVVLSKIN